LEKWCGSCAQAIHSRWY